MRTREEAEAYLKQTLNDSLRPLFGQYAELNDELKEKIKTTVAETLKRLVDQGAIDSGPAPEFRISFEGSKMTLDAENEAACDFLYGKDTEISNRAKEVLRLFKTMDGMADDMFADALSTED